MGIIFAPIGGLLLYASAQVEELIIDYSSCNSTAPVGLENAAELSKDRWHATFKSKNATSPPSWFRQPKQIRKTRNGIEYETDICSLQFEIPAELGPSVFLYYRLSNFYQNHRRYVKSLDLDQLKGKAVSNATIAGSTCDPLRLDPNGKAYYPCGLIANSLFNDTFVPPVRVGGSEEEVYEMTNKGISWSSDRELYKPTAYSPYDVSPPPNWAKRYPTGYNSTNPPPNLQEDEELQVWMRTAGLPTFSKLALRNDDVPMPAGSYRLDIEYSMLQPGRLLFTCFGVC